MSFLLKLFKKIKSANITIAGLDNAGKTTFVNYLITGRFEETTPTAGVNHEIIEFPKLQMKIFDLGGQEKFRSMWSQINERSDGLIYVIDCSDHERFDETNQILDQVLSSQIKDQIPVLVLLHKYDLPDKMTLPEFLKRSVLTDYDVNWAAFETSAKTGEGIYPAVKWFISEVENRT
jgi:small GTP-binding protein